MLQLYRHDVPRGIASLPKWMFPDGTDMLQVLWCPNPHADDYEPRVRLYWRTESELGTVMDANPALNLFTRGEDVDFTPRACILHPELVQEYPPITLTDPDEDDFRDGRLRILPAGLEEDCARWTATGEPRNDFDQHDYADHAGTPGWKMGGWLPNVGFWPPPAERCSCGAPTVLLLGATSEALNGPWLPNGDPGFRWGDPEDWDDNRPTGVWGGRGGQLWLLVCADDPTHPILTYAE
ncbi:hypothetical protein [Streptacidiphilus jiangxiensis]|uniref:hypothetical protein n=1 Tax=Streptacidiphilus jiangxiensis TaxID=235985 RepID=UPI0011601FFA|nr:hypothetical protein [Streptacidiphilus jiangxiensis]